MRRKDAWGLRSRSFIALATKLAYCDSTAPVTSGANGRTVTVGGLPSILKQSSRLTTTTLPVRLSVTLRVCCDVEVVSPHPAWNNTAAAHMISNVRIVAMLQTPTTRPDGRR